jgi:hypothetical protein
LHDRLVAVVGDQDRGGSGGPQHVAEFDDEAAAMATRVVEWSELA